MSFFYPGSLVFFFFSGRVFFSFSYACQRPFLSLPPAKSGGFPFIMLLWKAQAVWDETLDLFLRERLGVFIFYFLFPTSPSEVLLYYGWIGGGKRCWLMGDFFWGGVEGVYHSNSRR